MSDKTVNDMKIGETAVVAGLGCAGALRRRIIDMGITPGGGRHHAQSSADGRSAGDQCARI